MGATVSTNVAFASRGFFRQSDSRPELERTEAVINDLRARLAIPPAEQARIDTIKHELAEARHEVTSLRRGRYSKKKLVDRKHDILSRRDGIQGMIEVMEAYMSLSLVSLSNPENLAVFAAPMPKRLVAHVRNSDDALSRLYEQRFESQRGRDPSSMREPATGEALAEIIMARQNRRLHGLLEARDSNFSTMGNMVAQELYSNERLAELGRDLRNNSRELRVVNASLRDHGKRLGDAMKRKKEKLDELNELKAKSPLSAEERAEIDNTLKNLGFKLQMLNDAIGQELGFEAAALRYGSLQSSIEVHRIWRDENSLNKIIYEEAVKKLKKKYHGDFSLERADSWITKEELLTLNKMIWDVWARRTGNIYRKSLRFGADDTERALAQQLVWRDYLAAEAKDIDARSAWTDDRNVPPLFVCGIAALIDSTDGMRLKDLNVYVNMFYLLRAGRIIPMARGVPEGPGGESSATTGGPSAAAGQVGQTHGVVGEAASAQA